jgi:hypothetical protein
MDKIQNPQTPSPFPSPPRGEGWGEGQSLDIGAWNLFGLPARSRSGEGRDLKFGICIFRFVPNRFRNYEPYLATH